VLYGLRRAGCQEGRYAPSGGAPSSAATLGPLVRGEGSRCAEGVGLVVDADPRSGSAAASAGNISAILPHIAASRAFTLEVWLRARAQDSGMLRKRMNPTTTRTGRTRTRTLPTSDVLSCRS